MNLRHKVIAVAMLMIIFFAGNSLAFAQVVDGPLAWNHLKRQVKHMLYQDRFSELEKMASDFRSTKARFPDGAWKLNRFYQGFSSPKNDTPEGWKRFLSIFDKWLAKYPDSVTARTAAARGWMEFGWHARGIGFVDKVTEEGWRLFDERLRKAYSFISEKTERASDDCPERYNILLQLATYQGSGRAQFEALLHEATSFQPDYYYYYFDKAQYLLPRWHGVKGDTLKFALETTKLPSENGGKTLYADIVMTYWDNEYKSFDEDGISRELVKQAIIESRREYPSSPWVLNYTCSFACLAGDKETARKLFKEIGDHPYVEAWSYTSGVSKFKKWRDWALGDSKPGDKSEKLTFPGGTEDFREMMSLAKDGDAEAQNEIGLMLEHGELVEKNLAEAAKWYLKSAMQGNHEAQESYARLFFNGQEPIERDFKKCSKWYYIAAMQGDSNAASSLGLMYKNGFGLEKDLSKAYVWYSQVTQWNEPQVKELAAKLTAEQFARAESEAKKLKDEIHINMESAEVRPIDPDSVKVPQMKLAAPVKIETAPHLKLPTGNLLEGIKWQLSGGAKANGKSLSIENGGKLEALIKVDQCSQGCVLVGAKIRHSRPQAKVGGAPFFMGNLVYRGVDSMRIGMGLLVPPTVKEKDGPWFQVRPVSSGFDAVEISFGTAGTQEEEKKGSRTEFSDIRVMIFPTCEEAKAASESFYKP